MSDFRIVQLKRSSTPGAAPPASILLQGELAINLADKKLYTKDNTDAVIPLVTDTSAADVKNALNATGSAPIYACRAWLNLNGIGPGISIRGSGNVSSVTYFEPGVYGVNFATPLPDSNYAAVSVAEGTGGYAMRVTTCSQYSATGFNVRCSTVIGTPNFAPDEEDNSTISVVVSR
jgi:hypothetical protein